MHGFLNWQGNYCSHESLDLDNNLTLHVQHVAIPRGNGRARVAVNMWTNILLKRCVLTNVAQHNHIPCFGYALVLAINRLFTDLTGVQHLAANENRMINEVSACFKTSGVQYGAVDCTQYHLFLPGLPQNSRLIVVDVKDRTKKLLYKSNVVNPNDSPVNNVCLLLFNNHYYPLTSLPAWYGQNYYCIECEVRYASKHTCKPVRICSKCSVKNCPLLPTFTRCCKKCFGAFRNSTCLRNHLSNGVCDNSKSCDTCGQWFIGPVLDHVCNLSYCTYCSKSVKPDHQCFIEVKNDLMSSRGNMFSTTLSVLKTNTIDTETKRPVHEVNYCIAMSICDKCPDDGSCDDCLPVHTFSGLGGQNALDNFCKWAFDHPVNEGAVFIAHKSSNYDVHFILSYLIIKCGVV